MEPRPALGPQVGGLKHCLMWGPTGGGERQVGGGDRWEGGGGGGGRRGGIKGKVEVLEVGRGAGKGIRTPGGRDGRHSVHWDFTRHNIVHESNIRKGRP